MKRKKANPGQVQPDVIPDFMDSPLWRFNQKRSHWTLGDMARHIEDLENCIASSAPLMWAAAGKEKAAAEWEKKAYDLIRKV